MVASSSASSEGTSPRPAEGNGRAVAGRGELGGLVESLWRLADLQVKLWLAQIRQTAAKMLLGALLAVLAFVLAVVTILFLYAAVFHLLTDYLHVPTAWALLIFAGVHGLVAATLVVIALRVLKRGEKREGKVGGGRHE